MTDEQIIKALECCKIGECNDCPFYGVKEDCEVELPEEALNLINRKKAEIEQEIKEIKSEAIKEFAKQLCKGRVENDPVVIAVKAELKEMTEVKENEKQQR